jgi:hypothetical protein
MQTPFSTKTRLISIALVAILSLALAVAVAQAATNKSATKKGGKWISHASLNSFPGQGFRADAISALVASRKSGSGVKRSATDRFVADLKANAADYTVTAGATGKVILGAVAAGENPRCFGDSAANRFDLYALLQSYYSSSGQYGETAFDHALAMLALKAAHQKIPAKAVSFAKKQRGARGWSFSLSSSRGDDVESTALMIEALRAAGVKKSNKSLQSAFKWITFQRNSDSGYNPDGSGGVTQANTTAYAIRAADALGKNLSKTKRALRALQKSSGAFRTAPPPTVESKFAGIATSDAVIALSGRHYPVVSRSKAGTPCS